MRFSPPARLGVVGLVATTTVFLAMSHSGSPQTASGPLAPAPTPVELLVPEPTIPTLSPTPTPSESPSEPPSPSASPKPSTPKTSTTTKPKATKTPSAPKTTTAPQPAPNATWPGASNTGPSGKLATYKGDCEITKTGYELKSVDATKACDALLIRAKNVKITNSIVPRVDATAGGGFSVSIVDSDVRGGAWHDGAVWGYSFTLLRVNVTGGQHSVHCASNCTVIDSWLHDQYNPQGKDFHTNAFLSNGGANMTLRGNTLHCDSALNSTDGGCTGDLTLIGDFEPIRNVLVERNLLKANGSSISYCFRGGYHTSKPYGNPSDIVVRDNVFERGTNGRCGVHGPVTETSAQATAWSGNRWDDGEPVPLSE